LFWEPDPGAALVALPAPAEIAIPPCELRQVIETRRTVRDYADQPLGVDELSYLLWCTQGVQTITPRPSTLRPVPSAGARHPFETFLLLNRAAGLAPGLYRFAARQHALTLVTADPGIGKQVETAALEQEHITGGAATFIWAAFAYCTLWRYAERSYRYLLLDAGHVCQNLYLAAASVGCGVCAVGAFDDARINALLDLDGETEFVVYMATVGKVGQPARG
jgi:SagB-type dehydrogenase family enzyme